MENKKKDDKKNKKYPAKRIPIKYLRKLEQIGEGDWRHGLIKVVNIYETTDPSRVLLEDVDRLSEHAKELLSDNHYEHSVESGVPQLLVGWIRSGRVNPDKLKSPNKVLDGFQKNGKVKKV